MVGVVPFGPRRRVGHMVDAETACWLWVGTRGANGYGMVRVGSVRDGTRRWQLAHRAYYERFKGEIPSGLQIDHLCRNVSCVNPDHLEAVTPQLNCWRSNSPAGLSAHKTHCLRGHLFDQANTYFDKSTGHRYCRACSNERHRLARRTDAWDSDPDDCTDAPWGV